MGGSGSKVETSATVISNLIASVTQEQMSSCVTDVQASQQILVNKCKHVDIKNINLNQLVSVDIECVIKSLQQAVASEKLAQDIIAEAKKLNIGLASEIANVLDPPNNTVAKEYINTTLQEEIKQVTSNQVNNRISATQGIVASDCSDVKVIGVSATQTLEGTVRSVIASVDLSKILQNVNQKVKVKTSNISKDFPFLILIGGIILVVIVLILFSVLTRKK